MLIKDLYKTNKTLVSFEIFPPKKNQDNLNVLTDTIKEIAQIEEVVDNKIEKPDFISVTYSAGGGGNTQKTAEIASMIQKNYNIPALAHLTCVGTNHEKIESTLLDFKNKDIKNILALRGDLPEDKKEQALASPYHHASDLIRKISENSSFSVGAACYPEGHIEAESLEHDIECLKIKQDIGADFFVSQLFFDNSQFYNFLEKAHKAGIFKPISAGVMPFFSRAQLERMIFMCGSSLPSQIIKILHKYENNPADLQKAGVEYAQKQAMDLYSQKVDGIHLYTMNKPAVAKTIFSSLI